MACTFVGARWALDDEPAGVSDGVAVRPSRCNEGCSDEACCSFLAGLVAAFAAGDGNDKDTRRREPFGRRGRREHPDTLCEPGERQPWARWMIERGTAEERFMCTPT